jgi:histidine ammonia-lyase
MSRVHDKKPRSIRFDMERVTVEEIVAIAEGAATAVLSEAPEFRAGQIS